MEKFTKFDDPSTGINPFMPNKIITTTSLLDSNAKKTIEDMVKNMNLNEVHANSNPGETKESYTHLVLPGEKIETIAKKYKISINDIANWNNLYQNRIRVGQDLIVNAARARKPYLALNSIDNKTIGAIKKTDKSSQVKNTVEKGLCLFKDDKFIGIAHKSLPIGTLVLITSTENFKKIYARNKQVFGYHQVASGQIFYHYRGAACR
jgi:LysM repeat protein